VVVDVGCSVAQNERLQIRRMTGVNSNSHMPTWKRLEYIIYIYIYTYIQDAYVNVYISMHMQDQCIGPAQRTRCNRAHKFVDSLESHIQHMNRD
jgi:hypothetical protein